jgi:hypothetical protein
MQCVTDTTPLSKKKCGRVLTGAMRLTLCPNGEFFCIYLSTWAITSFSKKILFMEVVRWLMRFLEVG